MRYLDISYASESDRFTTAWNDCQFAIAAWTKDDVEILEQLLAEFTKKNIIIYVSSRNGNPFGNGGLVIALRDKIPNPEEFEIADLDRLELEDEDRKTGIRQRLIDAGLKCFALSPRLTKNASEPYNTEHKVIYWLNPYEQNRFNYGWFSVEDLEKWIQGTGPVIKMKEE